MRAVTEEHLRGDQLYGDDFDDSELREWFEAERKGYFNLFAEQHDEDGYEYHLLNWRYGFSKLAARSFETCLAFGCADGSDVEQISGRVAKFIAIEPAKEWWRNEIGGRPATYMMPNESGLIDLPDRSVDLVTCFGVLHHIPNVSRVMSEIARVMRPGAVLLLREPISSMGDFRYDRVGCTRYERGLPLHFLSDRLAANGLTVAHFAKVMFAPWTRLWERLGKTSISSPFGLFVDDLLCRAFAWNIHYRRSGLIEKFAPSSAFVVAHLPLSPYDPGTADTHGLDGVG